MAMLIGMLIDAGGVALLHKMLKAKHLATGEHMDRESKDQIIEIDDYEIVDENQNRGHRVIIK